jgi:hypothetical protein
MKCSVCGKYEIPMDTCWFFDIEKGTRRPLDRTCCACKKWGGEIYLELLRKRGVVY